MPYDWHVLLLQSWLKYVPLSIAGTFFFNLCIYSKFHFCEVLCGNTVLCFYQDAFGIFSVPETIDVGDCLIGGCKVSRISLRNEGGPGRFCMMSRSSWPATNFKVSSRKPLQISLMIYTYPILVPWQHWALAEDNNYHCLWSCPSTFKKRCV